MRRAQTWCSTCEGETTSFGTSDRCTRRTCVRRGSLHVHDKVPGRPRGEAKRTCGARKDGGTCGRTGGRGETDGTGRRNVPRERIGVGPLHEDEAAAKTAGVLGDPGACKILGTKLAWEGVRARNGLVPFADRHDARTLQEEYIKDEQKNLKRELLRAQEEVKRIQSVPLVIGQFLEMVDTNSGIIGSTTGSNYYVRILSTLNRELLKPSSSVALHRHSNALVDILPPEADSSISLMTDSERPDVTYSVRLANENDWRPMAKSRALG